MPLSIHEHFTREVVNIILREIQTVADGLPPTSALSRFLGEIRSFGCADVYAADDPRHRRSPDASIRCEGTRFPAIVIETATAPQKKLRRVADDWITLRNGNVKMVIGLELSHQRPTAISSETQASQVLVWEPVLKRELNHDVLISQCTLQKVSCAITGARDEMIRSSSLDWLVTDLESSSWLSCNSCEHRCLDHSGLRSGASDHPRPLSGSRASAVLERGIHLALPPWH